MTPTDQASVLAGPPFDPLLTVPQVADRLNASERYVRRLIEERRIEFVCIGRKIWMAGSVVDALIERGRVHPTAGPAASRDGQQTRLRTSPAAPVGTLAGTVPRPGRHRPARALHLRPQA
jgi:excisionase family DNA binding protein